MSMQDTSWEEMVIMVVIMAIMAIMAVILQIKLAELVEPVELHDQQHQLVKQHQQHQQHELLLTRILQTTVQMRCGGCRCFNIRCSENYLRFTSQSSNSLQQHFRLRCLRSLA